MFRTGLTILVFLLSYGAFADDADKIKRNFLSNMTSSLAQSLENAIGGEGDTEVSIKSGQDYKPEFSIMSVRPLAVHPEVDVWFVQLQINETNIRGADRLSINTGVGYRKLQENKKSFVGGNAFFDWDEEGNIRTSIGLELRASAFEAIANFYKPLSGGQKTNNDHTERVLGGYDVSVIGEVPYLPWANIIANHYKWRADKNSKDSEGEKISLELTITRNLIIEAGTDDNNLDGDNNFFSAYLIFPGRKNATATTNFIGASAFSSGDMSGQLLSKVRRTNKIIVESEKSGFVVARSN